MVAVTFGIAWIKLKRIFINGNKRSRRIWTCVLSSIQSNVYVNRHWILAHSFDRTDITVAGSAEGFDQSSACYSFPRCHVCPIWHCNCRLEELLRKRAMTIRQWLKPAWLHKLIRLQTCSTAIFALISIYYTVLNGDFD